MTRKSRLRTRLLAGIALFAAVDIYTKVWASRALVDGGIALPGPIDLRLTLNQGVAFGAFGDLPAPITIVVTAAVTIILVIAGLRGAFPAMPCTFIAGGALGNIIDRIQGGSVVDMFHTGWWPTFNLADIFITVGMGLLVAGHLWKPERPKTTGTSLPSNQLSRDDE